MLDLMSDATVKYEALLLRESGYAIINIVLEKFMAFLT